MTAKLTPREHEAITLRQRGMTQQHIADAMHISRSRVRHLIDNANRKLAAARKDAAA